uniref:Uncharacterized protein n=1 Tax=Glossina austeni TaxID=7395 RepID=A0A1A9VIZ2_GLOAU
MQSIDSGGELKEQNNTTVTTSTTSHNESTTSFTTNNTTSTNSTALNNDTISKNPFKQQPLNQRHHHSQHQQHNGSADAERGDGNNYTGILGVGTPAASTNSNRQTKMTTTPSPIPPPDDHRQEDYRAAGSWAAFKNWMIQWRGSRRLVLVIVAIALLLDNMLLTTVGDSCPFFTENFAGPGKDLYTIPNQQIAAERKVRVYVGIN